MVHCLCRTCQRGLRLVPWSNIGVLYLIAMSNDIASPVFNSVLLQDTCVERAGPMFFYWPKLLDPFLISTVFPFSSFCLLVGIVCCGL